LYRVFSIFAGKACLVGAMGPPSGKTLVLWQAKKNSGDDWRKRTSAFRKA
jgi:hypothetical protein